MSDATATANAASAAAKKPGKSANKKRVCLPVTLTTKEGDEIVTYPPGTPVLLDEKEADELIARYGEIKPVAKPADKDE